MTIYDKKCIKSGATAKQITLWSSLICGIFYCIYAQVFEVNFEIKQILNYKDLIPFINLITLCGIFLFIYRRWILNFVDLKNQAKIRVLEPSLMILLSVLFLDENLNIYSILAFGFMAIGIVISTNLKTSKPL